MEEKIEFTSLADASPKELAEEIAKVLDDKKGKDIKVIYVADKTDISDYFVLANGTSNTHIRTLADEVEYVIGEREVKPLSYEGRGNGTWVLLDYGRVVVHVFSREAREFYNLDKLYKEKRAEETEEN
ncbi:MAG: ribosome silencing factor [Clostridia bacterium]|nr:ribosome silencing factor [Clostridia bacterium]